MEKELITLSTREIERLRIIHKVMDRNVTQIEASEILGITDRQIRNIITKVKERGDQGIAHRNRGRAAPNKMRKEPGENIANVKTGSFHVAKNRKFLLCLDRSIQHIDINFFLC